MNSTTKSISTPEAEAQGDPIMQKAQKLIDELRALIEPGKGCVIVAFGIPREQTESDNQSDVLAVVSAKGDSNTAKVLLKTLMEGGPDEVGEGVFNCRTLVMMDRILQEKKKQNIKD